MNNRPSCYLMEGCAAIREVQANQLSYVQNMAAKAKPRSTKAERVPTHPVHVFSAEGEEHLRRVRHICSGLPNTIEKLSHGSPTFFHKKVYCRFTQNVEKRVAVWIPVPPGEQSALIRSISGRRTWASTVGLGSCSIELTMKSLPSIFTRPGR
jgi:hypothetical protein